MLGQISGARQGRDGMRHASSIFTFGRSHLWLGAPMAPASAPPIRGVDARFEAVARRRRAAPIRIRTLKQNCLKLLPGTANFDYSLTARQFQIAMANRVVRSPHRVGLIAYASSDGYALPRPRRLWDTRNFPKQSQLTWPFRGGRHLVAKTPSQPALQTKAFDLIGAQEGTEQSA